MVGLAALYFSYAAVMKLVPSAHAFHREMPLIIRYTKRPMRTTTICHLNRFLFGPSEVTHDKTVSEVVLPKDDYRTVHAAKILNLQNGDTIRAGIVSCKDHGGLTTDNAVVEWIPEGKVKKTEPLKNGNPPGSLRIRLESLEPPQETFVPSVSLILALPRPLQLGRMLSMISQVGVDRLILTEARKVPKDYFGSHLFRKPHLLTERLIEGLGQAGDVRLPQVQIVRHLSNFLNNELDQLFPSDSYARVLAHPERITSSDDTRSPSTSRRMRHVSFPNNRRRRIVLAVGPEGGWEEPEEIDRLVKCHGFQQISMGSRVLRSDCAVVSLLALAHDVCNDYV